MLARFECRMDFRSVKLSILSIPLLLFFAVYGRDSDSNDVPITRYCLQTDSYKKHSDALSTLAVNFSNSRFCFLMILTWFRRCWNRSITCFLDSFSSSFILAHLRGWPLEKQPIGVPGRNPPNVSKCVMFVPVLFGMLILLIYQHISIDLFLIASPLWQVKQTILILRASVDHTGLYLNLPTYYLCPVQWR